tara:strand:+ start:1952 stop:2371 length:420 start_codon:yes stop_codon:yes gene_type:complete
MAFPTASVTTTNLDAGTDDPSLARADLLDGVQKLNTIISEGGAANGVALLDSSAKLSANQMPTTITATGVQVFNPSSGVVHIQDVLRLTSKTVAQLTALSPNEGDIAYCSNGNAGAKTMAIYDGTNWKVVALGATISAT